MQTIKLLTLGCRLNEAESERWADDFHRRGFDLVAADAPAHLIVINTCGVTANAMRKSRQLVRREHRLNPSAQIIVSGCAATLEPAALAREPSVTRVIANVDKDQLVATVLTDRAASEIGKLPARAPDALPLHTRHRQRAFIKAQDGCRYQCSFCVTTLARGDERSRPLAKIVAAIRRWEQAGIQEVVLTGVQLGGYGRDRGGNLTELIAEVLATTTVARLRLGAVEPWDLDTDFWALFADDRLMPHLHLPLQSGSDAVLRRMARRCKTADFAELAARARAQVPHFNLTTDIIVGFPGETANDWQQTLDFVEQMAFGDVHIFSYSPRAGTAAALLPNAIDAATKRQRNTELQMLAQQLRKKMLHRQLGQRVPVLIEGMDSASNNERFGYTPNYLPVQLVGVGAIGEQRLKAVTLTGVTTDEQQLIGV